MPPTYLDLAERDFLPVGLIELAAGVAVLIVVVGVLYKYSIWKRSIPKRLFSDARKQLGAGQLLSLFFSELGNRVVLQKDVITDSRVRRITHMMVFWGFWGLAFATTWTYIFYRDGTPRPLGDIGKLVGNVGGALVITGCTIILLRYALFDKYKKGAGFEIAFFSMIYGATITGFASELARLTAGAELLYTIYAIHLVFIIGLLVAAPFTHFFHALLVPFERYVSRVHSAVLAKDLGPEGDYRKAAMIDSAVAIRSGDASPTSPHWLRSKKRKEEEKEQEKEQDPDK
jgi:hypothetical protein